MYFRSIKEKEEYPIDQIEEQKRSRRSGFIAITCIIISSVLIIISFNLSLPNPYLPLSPTDPFPTPNVIVDTRPYSQWNESHIPGAISAHYTDCSSCFKYCVYSFDRSIAYILYGSEAHKAATFMDSQGFKHLYVIENYEVLLEEKK